jgi:NCS1 family nucleobase:cation symporter-1
MLAGNTATLITNQPDIARWSKTKTGAMWSQLFVGRVINVLNAFLTLMRFDRPTRLL